MAEGRFLSKNIAFSEQLGQVSLEADYLFMRIIPHLDAEGRIAGSPKSLRARVCPLRDDMTDEAVTIAIAELDQARLIVWYEVDGLHCIEFPNFAKYQVGLRKEREAPAKVPSSSALGATRVRINSAINTRLAEDSGVTPQNAGVDRDNSKLSEVKGSKEKLSEVNSSSPSAPRVKKRSEPKYPHYPVEVCDQLHQTYQRCRGATEYARFRKETAPLFPTDYAVDELVHAMEAWCEYVEGVGPDKARWEKIPGWVENVGRWVRIGAMPLVTLEGVTERGRLACGVTA